jgi:hypothetical protein
MTIGYNIIELRYILAPLLKSISGTLEFGTNCSRWVLVICCFLPALVYCFIETIKIHPIIFEPKKDRAWDI